MSVVQLQFEKVVKDIPVPVIIYDLNDTAILYANKAAVNLYGFSSEEFTAMKYSEIQVATSSISGLNGFTLFNAKLIQHRNKSGKLINVISSSEDINFDHRQARIITINTLLDNAINLVQIELQKKLSKIFSSEDSISISLSRTLRLICKELNFELAEYWSINDNMLMLDSNWMSDKIKNVLFSKDAWFYKFKINEGLPGRVWKLKRSILIKDITGDKDFRSIASSYYNIKSAAAFPVFNNDVFIGVVTLFSSGELTTSPEYLDKLFDVAGREIGLFVYRKTVEIENSKLLLQVGREKKKLNNIISNVPGVVWELCTIPDSKKLILNFISNYVEPLLGYPVEEWYSNPEFWLTTVHPDDRKKLSVSLNYFLHKRKSGIAEFRFISKSGEIKWLESGTTIVTDDSGIPIGIRGVLWDITEGKNSLDQVKMHVMQHAAIAQLGTMALKGTSLDELLNSAVEIVKRVLNCEYVKVLQLLPDESYFLLKAAVGWSAGLVGNIKIGNDNLSQAGYTLQSNIPVIVYDYKVEKRFKRAAILLDKEIASGISIKIPGKDKPFGVISVHTKNQRTFTNDDAIFLRAVANIISLLIERKNTETFLSESLKEKEVLLKEIHHRVKNNLQVISSLLNLQSKSITDPFSVEAFKESQNRIKSMALIHEKLYQKKTFLNIDLEDYVNELIVNLFDSYSFSDRSVKPVILIKDILLNIDKTVSLGLIINELVSNCLKHAFRNHNTEGEVMIKVDKIPRENNLCLIVKDNGCGFPDDLDFADSPTLGLQLVNTLVTQIEGTVEINNQNGAEVKIVFPSR